MAKTMAPEEEHKRDCLARWMLDHWCTRQQRQQSLKRMRKNVGEKFVADLEQRIQSEWDQRRKGRAA